MFDQLGKEVDSVKESPDNRPESLVDTTAGRPADTPLTQAETDSLDSIPLRQHSQRGAKPAYRGRRETRVSAPAAGQSAIRGYPGNEGEGVEVVIKGVNDRIRHNEIRAANRQLLEEMANYRHKPAQAVPGDVQARRGPFLPTVT